MEFETLKAMNEGMYPGLMMMMEAIALITVFFAIAGIAISIAGIVWLCLEETRARISAPRTARRVSPPSIWKPAPGMEVLMAHLSAWWRRRLTPGSITSAAED